LVDQFKTKPDKYLQTQQKKLGEV